MDFKLFLSPTKNVNQNPIRQKIVSLPNFSKEAESLVNVLKKYDVDDFCELMSISNKIAKLNLDRFNNWKKSCGSEEEFHAIQMYAGEAFKAFDFQSMNSCYFDKMQESIIILSGLYGLLKPFDLVYPYRLEMGLNYSHEVGYRNLHHFWSERLTSFLDKILKKDEVIFNLASQEYSKVIDFKKLGRSVITPHFKEFKNGKYAVNSMFSKNARGKMARFLMENELKIVQDLKSYNLEGYSYDDKLSNDNDWVFVR